MQGTQDGRSCIISSTDFDAAQQPSRSRRGDAFRDAARPGQPNRQWRGRGRGRGPLAIPLARVSVDDSADTGLSLHSFTHVLVSGSNEASFTQREEVLDRTPKKTRIEVHGDDKELPGQHDEQEDDDVEHDNTRIQVRRPV